MGRVRRDPKPKPNKAKSKTIMRAMGTMNIILRALSQHHLGENLQKEFHLTRGLMIDHVHPRAHPAL